jgi:hypothetical protein
MTESDLQMLVDFRTEVAAPNEETAKHIYLLATSGQKHGPSRLAPPRRRTRHPRLVVAFAVLALVIVPTALAFRGKIVDLFEGTPAPPAVATVFSQFNKLADFSTQQGFAAKVPHADVSQAHGVIEIETADGPEDLWTAPSDQGGKCWFIDFANDPPGPNGQLGFGGCDPSPPPASNINWGDVWVVSHPDLMTVWGSVYVDAAIMQLTLANGSTVNLPVIEGLFLGSLAKTDTVTQLTAYDAGGNKVAEWASPSG